MPLTSTITPAPLTVAEAWDLMITHGATLAHEAVRVRDWQRAIALCTALQDATKKQ